MSVSLSQIVPITQIQSIPLNELLSKIVDAATRGFKIYVTAAAYVKLKPLFDKLGISVREVGKITDPSYVLIKVSGDKVKIIVYENNTKLITRTTTLVTFEKVLTEIIEKAKGKPIDASSSGKYYELVLSEALKKTLEIPEADEDRGDNDEQ